FRYAFRALRTKNEGARSGVDRTRSIAFAVATGPLICSLPAALGRTHREENARIAHVSRKVTLRRQSRGRRAVFLVVGICDERSDSARASPIRRYPMIRSFVLSCLAWSIAVAATGCAIETGRSESTGEAESTMVLNRPPPAGGGGQCGGFLGLPCAQGFVCF